MINKVLMVGGAGYLGRHLYPALLQIGISVKITGTGRKQRKMGRQEVDYTELDFSNADSFSVLAGNTYDLVIILASSIEGLGSVDLSNNDMNNNVFYFNKFLAFLQRNIITQKYVYISSMTVYSDMNNSPVTETALLRPINTYGLSKLLAENMFTFFCHSNDLKGIIIRPPGLYGGDRQSGVIYNTIKKLISGERMQIESRGLGFWETINVEDFALLFVKFLSNYEWKENINIYNFSYGCEVDFYGTALTIAKTLGKSSKLDIDYENKDYKKLYLSNQKIEQLTGAHISFDESLKRYIERF